MDATIHGDASIKRVQDIEVISPTVLVGLGGTGKEVLLRLRQLFFERYGVAGFPIMRYLWIDTDVQDINIDGKALDYIAEEVKFKEWEKVDSQIKSDQFLELQRNKNQNAHIFKWFDGRLANLGSVVNGARQIRQLGRLAFFHHAFKNSDIRNKLGNAVEAVVKESNRKELQDKFGIEANKELRFLMVFSVAGGTGSGMFLDTSFLIRDVFESRNPDIIGYLVLPSVFSPDVHKAKPIYANAYSALKELEYYSMRRDLIDKSIGDNLTAKKQEKSFVSAHDFNVQWVAGSEEKTIPGPPFNTCYLIDNQTAAGGEIGPDSKTNLCDMIAENIFIDFSTQGFSNRKRSVRSNLDEYLTRELEYKYKEPGGKEDIHSEIFSCRFSAFGLSKLFMPVDRIRKACSYKLLSDLLKYITRTNPLDPTLDNTVRREFLPKLNLRVDRSRDDFRKALQNADGGKTFDSLIDNQWINKERPELLNFARNRFAGFGREIERRLDGYFRATLDEPTDPSEWGAFVKRIKYANKEKYLDEVKQSILDLTKNWIGNPYIRFDLAVEYLLALNRVLDKHCEFFKRASERAHNQANGAFDRTKTLQTLISDEENGTWYHKWSIQKTIELLCRSAAKYFREKVTALIFNTSAEICDELKSFIGTQREEEIQGSIRIIRKGLIQKLWKVKEDLIDMQQIFDKKLQSFEHMDSHLIFENLYQPGDFRKYYYIETNDGHHIEINDTYFKQLEMQWIDQLEISSIYHIIEEKEKIGMGKIIEKTEYFGKTKFDSAQFDVDAIKLFYEKYNKTPDRLASKIKHFAEYGKVWLRKSALASVESSIVENYAEEVEIGINQKGMQHAYYEDFVKQLSGFLEATNLKCTLGSTVDVSKDCAYIYNEYAGIPLMFIGKLNHYKDAYMDQTMNTSRSLHIDRNDDKFVDILTKSEDEVDSIIRSTRILLGCSILRILDLVVDEEGIESYVYQDPNHFPPTPRPLGTRQIATEILRKNPDLYNELDEKLGEIQNALNIPQRRQFFNILTYHYIGNDYKNKGIEPGPFPPTWIRVGQEYIQKFLPEYRAIRKLVDSQIKILKPKLKWTDEDLGKEFCEGYFELDKYSEKIAVRGKYLRIFKIEAIAEHLKK